MSEASRARGVWLLVGPSLFGDIMVKLQEIVEGSVEWFETNHKFYNEGVDIKNELDNSHVLVMKCEALCGKKKGHNGFKYESCGDARLIAKI
jgi:hypothetical protein